MLDVFIYLHAYIGYKHKFASFVFMDLCRRAPSNFCFCPLDAELLLVQLHIGAGGATAEEIRSNLRYSSTAKKEVRAHFHDAMNLLKIQRDFTAKNTKKFYFQEHLEVNKEFIAEADSFLKIYSKKVNFGEKGIAERINVELQSEVFKHNKNLQTVRPTTLNKSMNFLVVSAYFYQIEWKKQFTSRALTKFYPAEGESINTMTMRGRSFYSFYQSESLDAKLLWLDLKKPGASIIIVHPNLSSTVDDITAQINTLLDIEFNVFEETLVDVEIPTFALEVSLDFKAILEAFGVRRMFRTEVAELDEIVNEKDFMVDGFTQKIVLQMDQSVNMSKNSGTSGSSGKLPLPEAVIFKVDRPFVFLIKDNNMVILVGKIMHPNITYHIIGNSYERVIQTGRKNTSTDKKNPPSSSKHFSNTSKDKNNPPSNSINSASTSKSKTLLPRKSMNTPSTSKDTKNTPSNSINSASISKNKTHPPRSSMNTPSTSKDKKNPPVNSINSASTSKSKTLLPKKSMNTPSTSKDTKNPPSNSINSASTSTNKTHPPRSSTNIPSTSKYKKNPPSNSVNPPSTSKIKKNPPSNIINPPSTSKITKNPPSNIVNPPSTSKITKNPPSSRINIPSASKDNKNSPSNNINSASTSKNKNPPRNSANSASSSKDNKIPPNISKDKKDEKDKKNRGV